MTYPRVTDDGRTVWACCESTIGPPCQHLSESRMDPTMADAVALVEDQLGGTVMTEPSWGICDVHPGVHQHVHYPHPCVGWMEYEPMAPYAKVGQYLQSDTTPADQHGELIVHGVDGVDLEAEPVNMYSQFDQFILRQSDDPVKRDLEMVCEECGKILCDAEPGDRIGLLAFMCAEHTCGVSGN